MIALFVGYATGQSLIHRDGSSFEVAFASAADRRRQQFESDHLRSSDAKLYSTHSRLNDR